MGRDRHVVLVAAVFLSGCVSRVGSVKCDAPVNCTQDVIALLAKGEYESANCIIRDFPAQCAEGADIVGDVNPLAWSEGPKMPRLGGGAIWRKYLTWLSHQEIVVVPDEFFALAYELHKLNTKEQILLNAAFAKTPADRHLFLMLYEKRTQQLRASEVRDIAAVADHLKKAKASGLRSLGGVLIDRIVSDLEGKMRGGPSR